MGFALGEEGANFGVCGICLQGFFVVSSEEAANDLIELREVRKA